MRDQAIKTLTEKTGDAATAVSLWEMLVKKAYGGAEPTEKMFGELTRDETLAELPLGVRKALACLWPEPPATGGEVSSPPTDEKLKLKHVKTTDTAPLLKAYLKGSPPDWITAELLSRSTRKGQRAPSPCLFLKDGGGVYEAESIQWIEWIRAGAPLGDGMEIDGKFRRPVLIGAEKPEQTFPRDPFPSKGARGAQALTMPGFMSACGASLEVEPGKPVAPEVISFLVLVREREDPSVREQVDACARARTGGLPALITAHPLAKRAWDGGDRPDPTVSAEPEPEPAAGPFVEPTATPTAPRGGEVVRPDGWIPTLCFLGTRDDKPAWESLLKHLLPYVQAGVFNLTSDDDVPPGGEYARDVAANMARSDAVFCVATVDTIGSKATRSRVKKFNGPKVPVMLGHFSGLDLVLPGLTPMPASGEPALSTADRARVVADIAAFAQKLPPRRKPAPWGPDTLEKIHAAIVSAGLDRSKLVAGLEPRVAGKIRRAPGADAQVWIDLTTLEEEQANRFGYPLRTYVEAAAHLAKGRPEWTTLDDALAVLPDP